MADSLQFFTFEKYGKVYRIFILAFMINGSLPSYICKEKKIGGHNLTHYVHVIELIEAWSLMTFHSVEFR